jgi:elongation factor Ts
MAEITAAMVKSLRERTGTGMMDCKRALQETDGDIEAAIDLLRQQGSAKAAKRAARETSEGIVVIRESDGRDAVAMLEVSSETDFVARNEEFQAFAGRLAELALSADLPDGEILAGETVMERPAFDEARAEFESLRAKIGENLQVRRVVVFRPVDESGIGSYLHFGSGLGVLVELAGESSGEASALARDVAMHVAASNPIGITPDDIPEDERARERLVFVEQTKAEGKPEAIIDKIVEGRMRKYYAQNSLLMQGFVKDPDTTVASLLEAAAPGLTVRRFARFDIAE